jgi:hypothetical protein
MKEQEVSAAEWVEQEDVFCREERIERLEWLIANNPSIDHVFFPGGLITKQLFEEARYCFVYAQFLASILLSLAFVERVLASLFYAGGRDDLKRAGIAKLACEARNLGLLSQDEFSNLERLRQRRNPLAHFREPFHEETVEYRSLRSMHDGSGLAVSPEEVVANDAILALQLILHLLNRVCTPDAFASFVSRARTRWNSDKLTGRDHGG